MRRCAAAGGRVRRVPWQLARCAHPMRVVLGSLAHPLNLGVAIKVLPELVLFVSHYFTA